MSDENFLLNSRAVVKELSTVFEQIAPHSIDEITTALLEADKVLTVGVGRVAIALSAFVKRLNHIGIPTWMVGSVNEPPIKKNGLLLVGSGSGESLFPKNIALCAKKYDAKIALLTSSPNSTIAKISDVIVDFHCGSKSGTGIKSIQPMTTLFEQSLFIFGDLICLELMKRKGLSFEQVSSRHANLE